MNLSIKFTGNNQLSLAWGDLVTDPVDFVIPLNSAVLDEISWYLEVYGGQYITDIDNDRAAQIVKQLPVWGTQLFEAVFETDKCRTWFDEFSQISGHKKVVTVESTDGRILALPWELLCFPGGQFFIDAPFEISIRRCFKESGVSVALSPNERAH